MSTERTPLINGAARPGGLGSFRSFPAQDLTDDEILAQESAFSASESSVLAEAVERVPSCTQLDVCLWV